MKYKIVILILFILLITFGLYIYFIGNDGDLSDGVVDELLTQTLPSDPLKATYELNGENITLVDGFATTSDGGVIKKIDNIAYGDLDNDDDKDIAFILKEERDNAESYFIASAIKDESGFLGIKSIFLDTNINNLSLKIEDNLIVVSNKNFVRYFKILGISLVEIEQISEDEEVFKGNFIYSEDVRRFTECSTGNIYMISSDSHSLAALKAIYNEVSKNNKTDLVYIVVAGILEDINNSKVIKINSIMSVPKNVFCKNNNKINTEKHLEIN